MGNSPLFKDYNCPLDSVHVKAVMEYGNLDKELIKKYYSPTAVQMDLLLQAYETCKAFYGDMFITEDCKILFPKETADPILVIYDVVNYEDGSLERRGTYKKSMVIAIAPRIRLNEEEFSDMQTIEQLEKTNKAGGIKGNDKL